MVVGTAHREWSHSRWAELAAAVREHSSRDAIEVHQNNGSIDTYSGCVAVGPQVTRVDLTLGRDFLVVATWFKPGGLHRLLGLPLVELYDIPFDVSLLRGLRSGKSINNFGKRLITTECSKLSKPFYTVIVCRFLTTITQSSTGKLRW